MPSSYGFNVGARERRRTSGPMELVAGLLLIGVVCWLVFPRDLVSSLRRARVDAVTLSYTDTWLRAQPNDYALRLLLADRLVDLGLLDRAQDQLNYIRGHTVESRWRVPQRWLNARLAFARLMRIPPPRRSLSAASSRAQRQFSALDPGELDSAQLQQYATMAINLGRPEAAVNAYHLIAANRSLAAPWYRKSAGLLLASGRYREAAREYLRAQDADADHAAARRDFLDALATLQSGDLLKQAMDVAARRRGPFMNDQKVLYRLMNLARAAGDNDQAQFYAVHLLRLAPLSGGRDAP